MAVAARDIEVSMEERSEIVREYFDLIVYLNRANKLPNEKTEIDFEILEIEHDFIFCARVSDPNGPGKVALAKLVADQYWIAFSFYHFNNFARYVANILNAQELPDNVSHENVVKNFREQFKKLFAD